MPHPPVVVISTASMKALVAAGASGGGGFKGGMAVSFFGLPPDAFNDMVTDMEDVDRGCAPGSSLTLGRCFFGGGQSPSTEDLK